MHSVNILSVLALVGASLAAPAPNRGHHGHWTKGKVVWETVVHTVYVTEIAGAPKPTGPVGGNRPPPPPPAPVSSKAPVTQVIVTSAPPPPPSSSSIPKPAPSTVVVQPPPPPPPPSSTPKPSSTPAPPKPAPSSAAPPPPPPTQDTGYMATVNEWRAKLGLPAFQQSSKREATALKTAKDGNGNMVHQLLPGTFGQVLAPGKPDEFFHCFVGGWLCERPDMAGMNGICATASKGWYYTSTGHADILTSKNYKTIGCANAIGSNGVGIWACDLGQE